jgi:hypothetical protein
MGRPEDRTCPSCSAMCFGSKVFCFQCNFPKPEGGHSGRGGGGGSEAFNMISKGEYCTTHARARARAKAAEIRAT